MKTLTTIEELVQACELAIEYMRDIKHMPSSNPCDDEDWELFEQAIDSLAKSVFRGKKILARERNETRKNL